MVARTYTSLPPIVNIRFQFLFHSPLGVLFTFPSRYLCTIGHQEVFSLTRWSGRILTKFHVLHDTREYTLLVFLSFMYEAVTLFGCSFQSNSIKKKNYNSETVFSEHIYLTTNASQHIQVITWYVFRLFPFRSPLLRESLRFLFLALLRCFSSGRYSCYPMYSDNNILGLPGWVSPFGNPRIIAWLTAPRGLWQSSTSFIISWCQGIHQMLFSINHNFNWPR